MLYDNILWIYIIFRHNFLVPIGLHAKRILIRRYTYKLGHSVTDKILRKSFEVNCTDNPAGEVKQLKLKYGY